MSSLQQTRLPKPNFSEESLNARGFTLIEVLVSLGILLILAAVALPIVKGLIGDQKIDRAAQSVVAFFERARTEAIVEGRNVGVRIERLQPSVASTGTLDFGVSAGVRLRQLTGSPSYSGDAANAKVEISQISGTRLSLTFSPLADHQLLSLHGETNAPISNGALIELPGGLTASMTNMATVTTGDGEVTAEVDISVPSAPAGLVSTFPLNSFFGGARRSAYRIYRFPEPSNFASLGLPRGIAFDFSYCGTGARGSQFQASVTDSALENFPADLVFAPDGSVRLVSVDSTATSYESPDGLIFLLMGDVDGVLPSGLLSDSGNEVSTLKRLDSVWIVINPNTGRIYSAPNASSTEFINLGIAIQQARSLAIRGDANLKGS